MSPVIVVARIKAKPEAVEEMREELFKLVEPTRTRDPGCITYDLHQDNKDPSLFFFLEHWASDELLDKHLDSDHIKAYRKAAEGLLQESQVNRLTKIR
jgi:quinol monooxygenase YgiN